MSDTYPDDGGLFEKAAGDGDQIAAAYEACDYNRAMRAIQAAGDRANQYFNDAAPWELRKDPERQDDLRDICTIALNLFRQLAIYLAPGPAAAGGPDGASCWANPITSWEQSKTPLVGTKVNKFKHMMTRVDREKVQAMVEESKQADAAPSPAAQFNDSDEHIKAETIAEVISFDEFMKVDLRVARICRSQPRGGSPQAAPADAQFRWGRNPQRFRGHQECLRSGEARGPARCVRCQPLLRGR